jgi:hypothetical protein
MYISHGVSSSLNKQDTLISFFSVCHSVKQVKSQVKSQVTTLY